MSRWKFACTNCNFLNQISNLKFLNMKTLFFACIGLLLCSCQKDFENAVLIHETLSSPGNADLLTVNLPAQEAEQGAIQLSGIAFFDVADECNSAGQDADYSLIMTGDLEGCLFTYVDEFDCSPSGTYREVGREYFVGTYNGEFGTFWTEYKFEAKFEGCNEDGSYVGAEILGRCQHPIINDSGTGVFEGVTGRLLFKDDIEAGNYPYRGHLNGLDL